MGVPLPGLVSDFVRFQVLNSSAAKDSDVSGCDAASFSERFPAFERIMSPSSSRVKQPKK